MGFIGFNCLLVPGDPVDLSCRDFTFSEVVWSDIFDRFLLGSTGVVGLLTKSMVRLTVFLDCFRLFDCEFLVKLITADEVDIE